MDEIFKAVICEIHKKERYMVELMQMLGRKENILLYMFQYPDSKTYKKSDAHNSAEIQMNLGARATHMISFIDLISPLEALIKSHQRYIEALIKSLFDIQTYIQEQKSLRL